MTEHEKAHLQKVIDKRCPTLEKERLWILSEDFAPGNHWRESKIIIN
nr:hypothetical protein [uncultured Draconibacterium sp.]